MAKSFRNCNYIDSDSIQCDAFYDANEHPTMCAIHRRTVGTDLAANGINKSDYITRRQEHEKFVSQMTMAELDIHIAEIEKVIEQEKMKLLVTRARKGAELDKLSNAERAELRKIKTPKVEKVVKSPKTTDVKGLMGKAIESMMRLGITEQQAKEKLGL